MIRLLKLSLLLAVLPLAQSCALADALHHSHEHRLRAERTYEHAPSYLEAVENAEDAGPGAISRELTAIVPTNEDLIWRTFDDGIQRVLMVTWTTHKDYYPAKGTSYTDKFPVWLTAAPQLKNFIRRSGRTGADLTLRLEQLLGLPAGSGHNHVVELWVDPAHLFRPSADPEITDCEAVLDFPDVPGYLEISADYRSWFEEQARSRYEPGEGNGPPYPWTRLGYTYDWGNASSRVGLSEFVMRPGAAVIVESRTPTGEYGALPDPSGR